MLHIVEVTTVLVLGSLGGAPVRSFTLFGFRVYFQGISIYCRGNFRLLPWK